MEQFKVVIEKTEKGFGIYFAKAPASDVSDGGCAALAVDGFVEDPATHIEDMHTNVNAEALAALQLGDVITAVNGECCRGKEVADVLGLLRAASFGPHTLSFSRCVPVNSALAIEDNPPVVKARKSGFVGALLKVKSKIRAEIDGNEEQLLCEQLEDERFEKQWLGEFERLRKQYEAKWKTCTYTADEFCGLLYRSSDAQQKEYLLQQYPTLMEAWRGGKTSSSSSRLIPEWTAVTLSYSSAISYERADCSQPPGTQNAACGGKTTSIHCSQALQSVLQCLRVQFMWRSVDLQAFTLRLEAAGISSCSSLLEALDARSSYFERNFQSKEYPRLSKSMIRALHESVQHAVAVAAPSE